MEERVSIVTILSHVIIIFRIFPAELRVHILYKNFC